MREPGQPTVAFSRPSCGKGTLARNICQNRTTLGEGREAAAQMLEYCGKLCEHLRWMLTVWGGTGIGKTMALQAVVNEAIDGNADALNVYQICYVSPPYCERSGIAGDGLVFVCGEARILASRACQSVGYELYRRLLAIMHISIGMPMCHLETERRLCARQCLSNLGILLPVSRRPMRI